MAVGVGDSGAGETAVSTSCCPAHRHVHRRHCPIFIQWLAFPGSFFNCGGSCPLYTLALVAQIAARVKLTAERAEKTEFSFILSFASLSLYTFALTS